MKLSNKHITIYQTFTEFLEDWDKRFDDVKNILSYLNTYPELLNTIKLKNLHDSESIISEQKDWVKISAKFDHSLEKDFFKPYWVPIVRDSIDYFIDLSDDTYPIFETHFIFFEPYNWHKQFLVEDISSLLLASDENIPLQQIIEKNEGKRWEQVEDFFEQRKKMGYAGKLHVGQVIKEELVLEESNGIKVYPSESSIQISEVSSMIIGLLPFYLEIEVEKFTHRIRKPVENLSEVKLVRDMVFFLRNLGYRWVNGYRIKLKDFPGSYIIFHGGQAEAIIKDTAQSQNLIERLNQIFNP